MVLQKIQIAVERIEKELSVIQNSNADSHNVKEMLEELLCEIRFMNTALNEIKDNTDWLSSDQNQKVEGHLKDLRRYVETIADRSDELAELKLIRELLQKVIKTSK